MSNMNTELWRQAQELASREYEIVVSEETLSNGEHVYVVEHPELTGCIAQANSLDEAIEELKDARTDYIYFLLEDGLPVPSPNTLHPNVIERD